jgi:hypothetical protein
LSGGAKNISIGPWGHQYIPTIGCNVRVTGAFRPTEADIGQLFIFTRRLTRVRGTMLLQPLEDRDKDSGFSVNLMNGAQERTRTFTACTTGT